MVLNKKILILTCVLLSFISSAIALGVNFFDLPDYDGIFHDCTGDDFDQDDKCTLSKRNNYRSLKFANGTCVEMNDLKKSVWITENNKDLGHNYKGGYAKKCETYSQPLLCPNGAFAKEIEWDTEFEMTRGIKLSCYSPEFYESNATVLKSHPGVTFTSSDKRKCAAITGITFKVNYEKEAMVALDLKKNCSAGYSKGVRNFCEPQTVFSGIDVVIEKETKYIKNLTMICSEVPDIASTCNAEEEKHILLSYVGNNNSMESTFTIQKRFGVGRTSVMSDENKNEFEFYRSSGFEIAKSIPTLADNFKENLGSRNDTWFDWSNSTDEIWQEEQSAVIKIQTEAGCSIEVFEIVGRCSFMDVRLTFCVRVDICDGMSNETIIPIPDDILNLAYRKDIFTPVNNNKIHKYKAGAAKNHVKVVPPPMSFTDKMEQLFRNFKFFNLFDK